MSYLEGWTQHPQDPRFYYRGEVVKTETEVVQAAMEEARAHERSIVRHSSEQIGRVGDDLGSTLAPSAEKKSRGGRPYVGRAIQDGKIRFTSISQIVMFDPEMDGGCERRWAYAYIFGKKEKKTEAQLRGSEEYAKQLEEYLKTGVDTLGPVLRAAKHLFPKPGQDLDVEQRLGDLGEAVRQRDLYLAERDPAKRALIGIEIARAARIVANLVPVDGAPDFRHRRGQYVDAEGNVRDEEYGTLVGEIGDLKSTARINDYVSKKGEGKLYRGYAKTAEQVMAHPQMVCYGKHAADLYEGITHVRLSHIYAQTKNGYAAAKRTGLITVDEVRARWRKVEGVVTDMEQLTASATKPEDFPPNENSCRAYGRLCTHDAYCNRPLRTIGVVFGEDNDTGEDAMTDNGMFGSVQNGVGAQQPPAVPAREDLGMFGSVSGGAPAPLPPPVAAPPPLTEEQRQRIYQESLLKYQEQPPRPSVMFGDCGGCKQPMNNLNASRLQDGRVQHIGCPVNAPAALAIAVKVDIGAVNPPDSPKVDPVASAAPLPPEVIAQIQHPALKERAETHAALASARQAEEDAKTAPADRKSSGKCPAGGRQVQLTQADVANIKKYPCPDCGKKVSLKEVAADYTHATLPGHIVPKPEEGAALPAVPPAGPPPLPSSVAAAAVPQPPPLPASATVPPPPLPIAAESRQAMQHANFGIEPGALPGQTSLPLIPAVPQVPPPLPAAAALMDGPVSKATEPFGGGERQGLLILRDLQRFKIKALEDVALEVFGALSRGVPPDPGCVARLATALFAVEPRSVAR